MHTLIKNSTQTIISPFSTVQILD